MFYILSRLRESKIIN